MKERPTSQTLRFGRYEVLEEIGRGAMGVVFKARDPKIGRMVALKTIHLAGSLDPEAKTQYLERFYREASAAGRLSHANVVTVYDAGEEGDVPFIALELVPGQGLEAFLAARSPLPWREAVGVLLQVAEGLQFAHEQGVVHRDIKPANILLTPDGRAKITDFGVAKVTGSHLTQEAQILGTPSYMAPELILGHQADHRVDIFALGCIAYELLAGARPFPGGDLSRVCYCIVHEDPQPLSDYPGDIPIPMQSIVLKALAKVPTARYQRASDFAAALRALPEGRSGETSPERLPETVVSRRPPVPDRPTTVDLPSQPSGAKVEPQILPRLGRVLVALGERASLWTRRVREYRRYVWPAAAIGGLFLLAGVTWAIRQADSAVRARQHLEAGRPEVAISLLVDAREKAPKRADLAFLLGEAYAQSGMGIRALSAYRQAIELDEAYQDDQDLARRLVEMLEREETAGEAGEVLAIMGETSIRLLLEATESPHYTIRWNAAEVLRQMGRQPDYVLLYILDLKHEDCFTRKKAAKRLGEQGDRRAIPALRHARQRSPLVNLCMFGALDDALKRLGSR